MHEMHSLRTVSGQMPYCLTRVKTRVILFALALTLSALASAQQKTSTASSTTTALGQGQRDSGVVRLGAGDLIDVQVFNTPELSASRLRIGSDGQIELPVAGNIRLLGFTPAEASAAIESRLRDDKMMLDPHVVVLVTEYATQGVRVLGEVRNPGTYLLLGPHSLYDALSAAGGVTPQQGAMITVTHQDDLANPDEVPVNSPNYSEQERLEGIRPGDVIFVSRADAIYVIGDVGRPGEYFIQNGQKLRLLNAVALAAGLNQTAATSKASVVRREGDGAITIPVNLNQVQRNKEIDLVLNPGDVLVVPRSGVKTFLNYAIPNATSAVVGSVAAALVVR